MKPTDVAVVLKLLSATLPGAHIDEQTPAVWADACMTVDPAVGLEAGRRMTRTLSSKDRFPSPADFMEFVKLVKREQAPVTRALPESPVQREQMRRMIAETKEALALQRANLGKHRHGPLGPCPVCALLRAEQEAF